MFYRAPVSALPSCTLFFLSLLIAFTFSKGLTGQARTCVCLYSSCTMKALFTFNPGELPITTACCPAKVPETLGWPCRKCFAITMPWENSVR